MDDQSLGASWYDGCLFFGRSTILLADLLRRSSELLMLFISWLVYRKVMKGSTKTFNYGYGKLESLASLAIACVMVISFGIVANTAFQQFRNPVESGWILSAVVYKSRFQMHVCQLC